MRNVTTIPYHPLGMETPPPLSTRMHRQSLPQPFRPHRWVKRGKISRQGCLGSRPIGGFEPRRKVKGFLPSAIVYVTKYRGFYPLPTALTPEVIREFNAAMRAFRDARYQP